MTLQVELITGVSVGIELVTPLPDEGINLTLIVDLLIFRLLFQWPSSEE